VPTYADKLEVKAQLFYETDDGRVDRITDQTVLKSGQHVGLVDRFINTFTFYVRTSSSLYFHRKMTGESLISWTYR